MYVGDVGVYRDHITSFFQSKNGCSQWKKLQVIRKVMIANNYPKEPIATGYFANTLFRFAIGLGTYAAPKPTLIRLRELPTAHIWGDPGYSLTQKETFHATALVNLLL